MVRYSFKISNHRHEYVDGWISRWHPNVAYFWRIFAAHASRRKEHHAHPISALKQRLRLEHHPLYQLK